MNHDEPQLPAVSGEETAVPGALTGVGRREWVRLLPQLTESGVLTTADLAAFEDYCLALSDLRRYEAKARRAGLEAAIAKGLAGMVVKLRGQVAQLRARLGLDPSSRSTVKAASRAQRRNKLEAFLGRKHG